jgi:competence protein ComEC
MRLRALPTLRFLLPLVMGILTYEYLSKPSFTILTFFLVSGFITGCIAVYFPKTKLLRLAFLFLFFFLGLFISKINDEQEWPEHILIFGEVEAYMVNINTATETKPKSFKTTGNVLAVKQNGHWKPSKGKTLLYFNKSAGVYPEFGQTYLLKGKPRPIEPPKNPLEFNYKQYQARKNIYTHHFIRENEFALLGVNNLNPLFHFAHRLNLYTHQVFKATLDSEKELGVAEALVAGMKAELDNETKQAYSDTGAIHILAVSGMHVAILFSIFSFSLGLVFDKKKWPFNSIIIVLLWVYALFTGLSPSVCRATVMFTLFQVGTLLRRDENPINTLSGSALILLLINPTWLFDVGFQLSYLAVLSILIFYRKLNNLLVIRFWPLRWLWEVSIISFAAQLLTFPLSVYYFHQFPNYFLFANPGVAFLSYSILPLGLLLLLLANVPYINQLLIWGLKYSIVALNTFVDFVQAIPHAVTNHLHISPLSVCLLFVCIMAFYVFFNDKNLRALQVATISLLILCGLKLHKVWIQNHQHELVLHYIPNGYGISIMNGRTADFISSNSLVQDPLTYQFHLKNYYAAAGVKKNQSLEIPSDENLNIQHSFLNLLWVKSPTDLTSLQNTNYIVSSNNVITDLAMLGVFKGTLVLDGSNKKWVVEKLEEQSHEFPIRIISLYKSGSKVLKLNEKNN